MMTELSLNVLDVVQNSIRANADLIQIRVEINSELDRLIITISDNGCGMNSDQIAKVEDPFYTTRTTRSVGLGVPFFRYAALVTGGDFCIDSKPGIGTVVTAVFVLSHIDRMPLGDMTSTIHTLITLNTTIDFLYFYQVDEKSFTLDTREFREILEGVPFDIPEVSSYIKEYLKENQLEVDAGRIF
ncbi:ATP-binding protein [Anaerocolumna sp. MB42-C2]|uniref:ATP-binding protein n=1 Tax=Anaerocolumna sp. MB42-C2 TaxID=3070997 RepID=UPI0027DF6099|nr:ATP-binding protein [Anaerocolumna sp. MB42-C2]WMJ85262.1 ATP-binding protein [Anaerocolumna sp. MB42-C2]